MSSSDLFYLNKSSTTHFAGFRNGWGSGPAIWSHLKEKYIQGYDFDMKKTWALAGAPHVSDEEKCVLMITFDRAFIPKHRLMEAGEACKEVYKQMTGYEGVNHWDAIGDALQEASKARLSHHCRGVVLQCTSVTDIWSNPSGDWLENAWSIMK